VAWGVKPFLFFENQYGHDSKRYPKKVMLKNIFEKIGTPHQKNPGYAPVLTLV